MAEVELIANLPHHDVHLPDQTAAMVVPDGDTQFVVQDGYASLNLLIVGIGKVILKQKFAFQVVFLPCLKHDEGRDGAWHYPCLGCLARKRRAEAGGGDGGEVDGFVVGVDNLNLVLVIALQWGK